MSYRHKQLGMDDNSTDFTQNDPFDAWTSSKDISSTSDFVMPVEEAIGQKRGYNGRIYGAPPPKRAAPSIRLGAGYKWNLQALAQAAAAVETGGKSPVSALNELGVRVAYTVLRQGGPAHCPSFTVAVTVADMTFEGWGHSKREARVSAAKACLSALLARAGRVLPAAAPQDFTSDEPKPPPSDFQCLEAQAKPAELETKQPETPPAVSMPPPAPTAGAALFGAQGAAPVHKSPINSLYESCPGLSFHCTFGDGSVLDQAQAPMQLSHSMRFKVVCQIKDQTFEGYGSSKKLAKLAAARAALAVLEEGRAPAAAPAAPGCLPQPLADRIGKLVNEKFHELMKGDIVHSKRKVLAGIVMTVNNKPDAAKVIAVTTGTKCVSGEHMSVRGRAVNDCHAEVAARRCLQRHLYAQLLMYADATDPTVTIAESDLEPVPGGGFQLKPDRQLHLYVSTAPCGDGRIFSPHEQPDPTPDRHPNRLARGQLRTKIESGEGTIPVKNCSNIVQTWDGVMQGERLLTMSCSDKVCRWCVVGMQGALLSQLLRPVYLHSLVLGSLLHPHHMYRAICGRIENHLQSLPPPFRLQRPLLARAASTEARTPARAPSFSVCWASTEPLPEVINATTGKLESGQPSLLCKQSMFGRWQHLVTRLPLLPQDPESTEPAVLPDKPDSLLYNEAKQLCPSYQVAKERLIEAFDKAKLGRWIKKPIEQDQFICEIVDAPTHALFAWAGRARARSAAQRDRTERDDDTNDRDSETRFNRDYLSDVGEQNDVDQLGRVNRGRSGSGEDRREKGESENVGRNESGRGLLGELVGTNEWSANDGRDKLLRDGIDRNKDRVSYGCGDVRGVKYQDERDESNCLGKGNERNRNDVARGSVDYKRRELGVGDANNCIKMRQNEANEQQCGDVCRNDQQSIATCYNSVDQIVNKDEESQIRKTKFNLEDVSEPVNKSNESKGLDKYKAGMELIKKLRQSKANTFQLQSHLNENPVPKLRQPIFNNDGNKENNRNVNNNLLASNFNLPKDNANQSDLTKFKIADIKDRHIYDTVFEDKSNKNNTNVIYVGGIDNLKDRLSQKDLNNLVDKVRQLNIGESELLPKNEARDGTWLDRFNTTQCRINKPQRNDHDQKLGSQVLKKKLMLYHQLKGKSI